MGLSRKIHRRCTCGCEEITGPGMKYIRGHNHRGKKCSEETKRKISLTMLGRPPFFKGKRHSIESRIKMALSSSKCNPNYEYCDAWKDREYKKDLLKDYCENEGCKGGSKQLQNHHINLNKKDCRPCNVMTLCASCHQYLHLALYHINGKKAERLDFLTIIREYRIVYCHKKTRKTVTVRRNGTHPEPPHQI